MKRMQELLVIVLLAICSQMSAEPVTRQQAQQKAQAFFQKEGKTISVSQLRRAPARDKSTGEEEVEPYYVFNVGNNDGFVFVAGDDLAPDILGYSTRGHFDIDEIPENMKAWLDGYAEQIEYLRKHPSARRAEATNRESVTPLLKKENKEEITWAQRNPYNSKCPLWKDIYNEWNGSDEERVVTGCVATAMAQIMKYWEHPKGYTTSIPEYEAEIYDYRTIVNEETHSSEVQKVEIDKHIIEELPPIAFDWENMLEHYEPNLPNYTNEQALAVANLMRYCAQSAKMNYSPGSNEGGSNYLNFFIFGYDNELKYRENFEIAEWENLIYNELKSGRPVFFGGNKKNKSAHAFVVDGYRNDGLFHINWGWGWTSADPSAATDSYYILTIADGIADENVPNESNPFRYKQFACVGIQPIDDYNSANYDFESGGIYYRVETKKVSTGGQADSRRRVAGWLPDGYNPPPKFTTKEIAIVSRGEDPYEGDITIPIEVNYNGKTFPVHRVEKYAFVNCMELSTITFEGLPEIDSKAFFNCPRLTDVYAYGSIPYDISEDAFDESIYQTATLHVPEGQIDKFKDKKGWQNFLYKIDAAGYADNGSSEEGENILFTDSEVENICLSNWDSDGNGVLTKNEAAAVTDIGDLFYGNQQLASFDELKYFTGLTTIPEYAFTGCTNLVSVSLPPSITHVGEGAFWQCNSLVSVHMNEGLTELGDGAFALCTTLSFADIPSTVTKIGTYAFQDCVSLTSCDLPSGLTDIPYAAFIRCSKLKTVLLESNITSIDNYAFCDCVSLSNIELSNKLTSIGYLAFCGCEQLSSIDFPTSLKTIKAGAFVRSGLTSINLPASLETIEDQAFAGCNNLTSLSISSNVSSIGSLVVGWCKNLTSLTVDSSNPYYRSRGNGIIDRTTNMLVQSCPATIIPSDIVGIGVLGFGTVPGVEEVVLPDNIKNIGEGAFEECPDLKRVTLPANIESIDREAFLECSSLEKVTILNPTPITITDDVFHMLETWNEDKTESTTSEFTTATLYVPAGSKNSYQQAPGWKNFQIIVEMESASQNIHFADAEVKRICVENWDANGDGELSEVEAAAVSDIGRAFYHSAITSFDEFVCFTGLEAIPNYAFAGCSNLTSIIIPKGVNSLGDYHPFASCPVLLSISVDEENMTYDSRGNCNGIIETATNILVKGTQGMTIPASVTAIGPIAFSGYTEMTDITIPNQVKSIGIQAFYNCQSLQSIHIPSSVTSIDKEVFVNCLNLASITVDAANPVYDSRDNCNAIIETATHTLVEGCNGTVVPASVKHIGECAFGGRQFMESIDLPGNLLSIDANAFWLCHSMDKVIIPSSVQAIGEYAFEDCIDVTEVYSYIKNPFGINDNVFGMNYDASGNPSENYFSTATLYVPSGCKGAYQQAAGWKNFQNIVEMEPDSPNIQFADAEVKRICVENWDANDDGELSEVEAAAVEQLGSVFSENQMITSFEELRFFTGLTEIGDYSFSYCTNLKQIELPSLLEKLGEGVFYGCYQLESMFIPENVIEIGDWQFSYCENMKTLSVSSDNPFFYSMNNCILADFNNIGVVGYGCAGSTIPTVPKVKQIGMYAFEEVIGMNEIVIPNNIEAIGKQAFDQCADLEKITIGKNVTLIQNYAFCRNINLKQVYALNPVPVGINDNVFHTQIVWNEDGSFNTSKDFTTATLYVPSGSKEAYQQADGWKNFQNIVEILFGDVNGDQNVTIADAAAVVNKVLGQSSEDFDKVAADVNGDGSISIADALAIVNIILGKVP